MAILKVAHLGHPILRQVAEPVPPEAIRSPEIQRLVDDMIETMREYDGAGLAAPQVHVSRRIVVYEVEENRRYPDADPVPLRVLVNPTIVPLTERTEEDWEGCLSVPGLRGKVPRAVRVRVRAWDRNGGKIDEVVEGFHARVVQHECDHLDGKVFLDRMKSLESLAFLPEFERYHLGRGRPGHASR
ncbi:MAG: peptide deformylase [Candidatus Binatia bacterium]|nr:MAG: peptide deformylase [Candidatus Binatia bacterium]